MTAKTHDDDDPGLPPPWGTRPKNRRQLILAAASQLFYARGYSEVSVKDIAEAVNVAPSALYRHFTGKSGLLHDVVADVALVFSAALEQTVDADLADTVDLLASTALDHREVGVLWQRESRNLPDADRRSLWQDVTASVGQLAHKLCGARPDLAMDQAELLASCAIDSMLSISFHDLELPRIEFQSLLAAVASKILRFEPAAPEGTPEAPETPETLPDRREQLLASAVHLFATKGFAAVSLDEIAAGAGIAGPSVYHYFDSKQQLLTTALDETRAKLVGSIAAASSSDADDEARLRTITSVYVDVALSHRDQIAVMITEVRHLKPDDRRASRQAQLAFIDSWSELLMRVRPLESTTSARIKVQMAQMVANDLGRTRRLHALPGFRESVHELCRVIQT